MTSALRDVDLRPIAAAFDLPGELVAAAPYGSGHINETFRVVCAAGRGDFILQRINTHVFREPVALMENIRRVTAHIAAKRPDLPDADRRRLRVIPSRSGASHHCDDAGGFWRAYNFIGGSVSLDAIETPAQAHAAARAFGEFQGMVADLPPPRLHETIPDFHHTPRRFAALAAALRADPHGRVAAARDEVAFALRRADLVGGLLEAGLPERVTHNDTKLNNVLLDAATGEALCVIDLDTIMPGLALYDFGDLVRTATSPAPEDERDLSRVRMQFPMFEALVRGYLEAAGSFLTAAERDLLVFSGKLITFEIGLRFLTDFLSGDVYFKIHRDGHNLDRCRTQFKLVESIEEQEAAMRRFVERCR